jgi:hypothetical protein
MEYGEAVENGGYAGERDAPHGYDEAHDNSDGSYRPPSSQRYYHEEPHDATRYQPPTEVSYPPSHGGYAEEPSARYGGEPKHSSPVESPTEVYTPNKPKRSSYHARYAPDQRPVVEGTAGEGYKAHSAPKGDAGVSKSLVRKQYKGHNDK